MEVFNVIIKSVSGNFWTCQMYNSCIFFTQFVFNPGRGLLWSCGIFMTVNYLVLIHSVFAFILDYFVPRVGFFYNKHVVSMLSLAKCVSCVCLASPTVSYYLTLCTLYRIVLMTLRSPIE